MPSADDQADAGKNLATAGDPASVDMGVQVVDGQERFARGQAQRLGGDQPDQQRTSQSRRVCDGDSVQIVQRHPSALERFVDHRQDALDMCPRGDLGHHAAEPAVQVVLRCHHRPQDLQTVRDDCRRRLVTGRFNR
jgi:hypothetical protein